MPSGARYKGCVLQTGLQFSNLLFPPPLQWSRQFGEAFTSHYVSYLLCEMPPPLSWAEYDCCGPLALLALNSMKNVLQRPNMLSLRACCLTVRNWICWLCTCGSGSLECSIDFGNHNAHTKITCFNKSGILRCPTVGLLCTEVNEYGDWDWLFVEGGFIGAFYG